MTVALPNAGGFTLKRVQEMLGLSRTVVAGLVAAGFVTPERGPRNQQLFTFQDLLLLRTAHALQRADIPTRKILAALTKLSKTLPDELPLTGLRITAVGSEVAVHDRDGRWNPDTGQVLMDFDVAPAGGDLTFLQRSSPVATASPPDADAWFRAGEQAEAIDAEGAERAYRAAIELDGGHEHAHINLGALLCEAGRCDEAVVVYGKALAAGASSAMLHFNHAMALEDLGLFDDAVKSYEAAIKLDPTFVDAHYNLGIILEKSGDAQGALRHFSAYKRMSKG